MHIRFQKLASVLLSFAIIGGTVLTSQFSVFAHETLNQSTDNNTTSLSDSYEYKINDDGTAEITKYTGLESELTIPSELDGYKVCKIGDRVFSKLSNLTSVIMPDTITDIGVGIFEYCENLRYIKISSNLSIIESGTFYHCENLSSITVPDSVTTIQVYAFAGCTSLTDIKLSENLTSLGIVAFSGCTNLKSIVLPNSLKLMAKGVF